MPRTRPHRTKRTRASANGRGLVHYLGVAVSAALLALTLAVAIAVVALPAVVGALAEDALGLLTGGTR